MNSDPLAQLDAMIRIADVEHQHYLAGQLRKLRESTAKIIDQRDALQSQVNEIMRAAYLGERPCHCN